MCSLPLWIYDIIDANLTHYCHTETRGDEDSMCLNTRKMVPCTYCVFLSLVAILFGIFGVITNAGNNNDNMTFTFSGLVLIVASITFTVSLFYSLIRCIRSGRGRLFCFPMMPPCPFRLCYESDEHYNTRNRSYHETHHHVNDDGVDSTTVIIVPLENNFTKAYSDANDSDDKEDTHE
jgi:hypothetical protein